MKYIIIVLKTVHQREESCMEKEFLTFIKGSFSVQLSNNQKIYMRELLEAEESLSKGVKVTVPNTHTRPGIQPAPTNQNGNLHDSMSFR